MFKLILSFLLAICFNVQAEECPVGGAVPEIVPGKTITMASQLDCSQNMHIEDGEYYAESSCKTYRSCIETKPPTEEQINNALKKIAILHGDYIKNRNDDPGNLKNLLFYESLSKYLKKNFPKQKDVMALCPSKIELKETPTCKMELMNRVIAPDERKTLEDVDGNSIAIDQYIENMISKIQNFDESQSTKDEKLETIHESFKSSDVKKEIIKLFKDNIILSNLKTENISSFLDKIHLEGQGIHRKKMAGTAILNLGVMIANKFCDKSFSEKNNLQSYCEEITSISKGEHIHSAYFPNNEINQIYSAELKFHVLNNQEEAILSKKLRCDAFSIGIVDSAGNKPPVITPEDAKKRKAQKVADKKRYEDDLAFISEVVTKESANVSRSNDSTPERLSIIESAQSDRNLNVRDSNLTKMSTSLDNEISIESKKGSVPNIIPNDVLSVEASVKVPNEMIIPPPKTEEVTVPQIPTVTSFTPGITSKKTQNTAIEGVGNVVNESDNSLQPTVDTSETDRLTAQLAEAEKQLKELKEKTLKKTQGDLVSALSKEKEALESKIESTKKGIEATKRAPASSEDTRQIISNSPKQAEEANRQVQAQTPTQTQIPPTAQEQSRVVSLPTSTAINPTSSTNSSSVLNYIMVELPKGMSLQDTVSSNDFIMAQIIKYEGKPFRILDPVKGEIEIIPSKSEDGKYIYVTRQVKKVKKVTEKKAPAKPNPARAPASEKQERTYFYKEMTKNLEDAAKK